MQAINAVALFNGSSLPVKEKELKNGRSVTFITKKAYGEQFGLKGQPLRRAHDKYRSELGLGVNMALGSALSSGQVLAQKVTETKTGFNVNFIRANELDLEADPKQVAAQLTDEELLKIVASRKSAKELAALGL